MAIVRHKQPLLRRIAMYWVDHARQAFSSLGELWRNPLASLMTLAVLGVSLALPSCFHVLLKNAEVVEGNWQTSSQISLYLRKDLPEQSILDMKQRILLYPEVESVTYMNRDEALKEFREISGFGDALEDRERQFLGAQVPAQPFLAVKVQVQPPHEDFHDARSLGQLKR